MICPQDLRAYNEGRLIFKWYTLTDYTDINDIMDEFKEFVKEKAGYIPEEWMIADYSDCPNFGEYPDYDKIQEYMDILNDSTIDADAYKIYMSWMGSGTSKEDFEERYMGEWDSFEDYIYELEGHEIDEKLGDLSYYFDWEKYADAMEQDYYVEDGHVFLAQ